MIELGIFVNNLAMFLSSLGIMVLSILLAPVAFISLISFFSKPRSIILFVILGLTTTLAGIVIVTYALSTLLSFFFM